ncbi:MAG: cytochrome c biogenesis protein CcsA [bacterium]|nr:MAG: cytochrome c biogenesis protein CcsA [bacterium]
MLKTTALLHNISLVLYGVAALLGALAAASRRIPPVAAFSAGAAGLAAQVVLLLVRWNAGGHLPVTGLFETQHFLALWVAAVALYFYLRYRGDSFLPAAMALAAVCLFFAGKGPMDVSPLTPAIDTPLFLIHVATSFAAYGLFAVAALAAVYRGAGLRGSSTGSEGRMMDESLYLGYILFTWCLIAGSLWAYLAWGSYWTWRIKNLWSWILWFYYSGVLHVRNRPRWQGWPVNVLALAGFALVLFTYLGLGLLFTTSHPLLPQK